MSQRLDFPIEMLQPDEGPGSRKLLDDRQRHIRMTGLQNLHQTSNHLFPGVEFGLAGMVGNEMLFKLLDGFQKVIGRFDQASTRELGDPRRRILNKESFIRSFGPQIWVLQMELVSYVACNIAEALFAAVETGLRRI